MSNHSTVDLVSSAEAAELLGIDRSGVSRRVRDGELVPAKTLGGKTGAHLFERSDVLALLAPATGSQPGGGGVPVSPDA